MGMILHIWKTIKRE